MSKIANLNGLLIALLLIVCASAGGATYAIHRVQVDGIPHPRQLVSIGRADMPYQVPAGRRLVITGIGIEIPHLYFAERSAHGSLDVDGVPAVFFLGGYDPPMQFGANYVGYATGIPVDEGRYADLE